MAIENAHLFQTVSARQDACVTTAGIFKQGHIILLVPVRQPLHRSLVFLDKRMKTGGL
ncbi:MAG: hypothetical protein ABMA01_23935 [Chthoniobacteraceae bacterium]